MTMRNVLSLRCCVFKKCGQVLADCCHQCGASGLSVSKSRRGISGRYSLASDGDYGRQENRVDAKSRLTPTQHTFDASRSEYLLPGPASPQGPSRFLGRNQATKRSSLPYDTEANPCSRPHRRSTKRCWEPLPPTANRWRTDRQDQGC